MLTIMFLCLTVLPQSDREALVMQRRPRPAREPAAAALS